MHYKELAWVGLAGMLASCAAQTPAPQPAPPPSPMALYDAGIRDAAIKQPADLEAKLTPILSKNVDVATWAYDLNSKSSGKLVRTLGSDVWVTLVPELKSRCAGLTGEALGLRLQQLLGLPPGDWADRKIFTFTVRASDVFRPCADPRINTTSCGLDVPDLHRAGLNAATVEAHQRFVLEQILSSYRVGFDRPGYPFTALGYTYDWKPDSETHHVGLSEYVVRHGATVRDVQEIGTGEYCSQQPS